MGNFKQACKTSSLKVELPEKQDFALRLSISRGCIATVLAPAYLRPPTITGIPIPHVTSVEEEILTLFLVQISKN